MAEVRSRTTSQRKVLHAGDLQGWNQGTESSSATLARNAKAFKGRSYDSIHLKNVRRTKNDFELRKKMKNAIPGPSPRKKYAKKVRDAMPPIASFC